MTAQLSASRPANPQRKVRSRQELLAAVLDPSRLPTPPVVALEVVAAAGRPDCDPAKLAALINRDPALCAKMLQAVNSCVFGLQRPVTSVARAVHVLGLRSVRSLALGLSLPVAQAGFGTADELREY